MRSLKHLPNITLQTEKARTVALGAACALKDPYPKIGLKMDINLTQKRY